MNAHAVAALEQALRLYRAPQLAQALRNDPLPEAGVDLVIRCASGEEAALVDASAQLTTSREVLREAAAFYLTQTLFARDADAWRVLGVRPGASQEVLRAHFRLLVHWLATSRNRDPLYALYGDRVQRAWTELRRSPEEIAARTQRRPPPAILPSRGARLRLDAERYGAGVLRTLRALPTWIVGSVAGVLLLILLAAYWVMQMGVSPASLVADHAAPPTVAMVAPVRSGTVTSPSVAPRQRSPTAARSAPSAAVSAIVAPTAIARFAPTVAAGTVLAPAAAGTVAAAYDPAAAASATAALALAAATAAAQGRALTSPAGTSTLPTVASLGAAAVTPSSAVPSAAVRVAAPSVPAIAARVAATTAAPATSASAAAAIATAASVSSQPSAAVQTLLQSFVGAYESADLRGFMALFAPDARENRGGIAAIREDYGQLFAGSDLRRLQLFDVHVVPAAYGMIDVRARYHAGVLMHGAAAMGHYSGVMRLVLRPDPQGLRIIQLLRSNEVVSKPHPGSGATR